MSERGDALKPHLRRVVRAQRSAMSAQDRAAATAGLTTQLGDLVSRLGARSLCCYLPVGDEPDTRPFLAGARSTGIEVLLPRSRADGGLDWSLDDGMHYRTGRFGIPEPAGAALAADAVDRVDLMLIPACAVDLAGNRLGWGRGFFDRALASLARRPPVFAVVFEADVVDAVPVEQHDEPVTGAVTPARIIFAAP